MERHFRLRMAAGMLLVSSVMATCTAGPAFGVTTDGVAANTFATGFPSNPKGIGPLGIAVDGAGRVYAVDSGVLYRFGHDGGEAAFHRLSKGSLGRIGGLAFGPSGGLYPPRWTDGPVGDVVQLSTSNGSVIRRVASNLA